jgi:siderophore synthetase component
VAATSSVRTVYDPQADVFAKFSLNVRITNCVRTSAWYELAGSVLLTGLLRPVLDGLRTAYPGTVLLGEPGYRTAALADRDLYQGLAVIARDGLRRHLAPGVTPVLAAALTEPALTEPVVAPFTGRDPDWLLGWWEAYVGLLAPPVLQLLFAHGVVLEPHLQNVLAGLDAGDWPVQVVLRDLEGVKLVAARHEARLAGLPPRVARSLVYDRERGWNRVAYCLFVNHLAEVAAAIADACPARDQARAVRLEAELWHRARRLLAGFGRTHGWTPELRALLSGVPLPAKANLKVRWARAADREASYVPVRNPLAGPVSFTPVLTTGPLRERQTEPALP